MTICDRTFELVTEQLKEMGYDGPCALSWDDTKVTEDWRLTYDPVEKAHFLVGSVNGPIRVADPAMADAIMEDPSYTLATKVRFFLYLASAFYPKLPIHLLGSTVLLASAINRGITHHGCRYTHHRKPRCRRACRIFTRYTIRTHPSRR